SSAGGAVKTSLSPYWLTGVLPLRHPGSSDRSGACWRGGSSLCRGGGILICSRDSSSFRGGLYGALPPLARRFGVSSQLGGAKRGPGVSFPGWSAVVGPGVSSRPASAGSSAVAGSFAGSGPVPPCRGADLGAGGSGSSGRRGGGRGGGEAPRFRCGCVARGPVRWGGRGGGGCRLVGWAGRGAEREDVAAFPVRDGVAGGLPVRDRVAGGGVRRCQAGGQQPLARLVGRPQQRLGRAGRRGHPPGPGRGLRFGRSALAGGGRARRRPGVVPGLRRGAGDQG